VTKVKESERRREMDMRTTCMLVVMAWVSLLIVPALVVAQKTPDVEATNVQWTHDVNSKHRLKGYYAGSPDPSPDFIQEVSATFRNGGAKTVKSCKVEGTSTRKPHLGSSIVFQEEQLNARKQFAIIAISQSNDLLQGGSISM
jgi:hypothetical protein